MSLNNAMSSPPSSRSPSPSPRARSSSSLDAAAERSSGSTMSLPSSLKFAGDKAGFPIFKKKFLAWCAVNRLDKFVLQARPPLREQAACNSRPASCYLPGPSALSLRSFFSFLFHRVSGTPTLRRLSLHPFLFFRFPSPRVTRSTVRVCSRRRSALALAHACTLSRSLVPTLISHSLSPLVLPFVCALVEAFTSLTRSIRIPRETIVESLTVVSRASL